MFLLYARLAKRRAPSDKGFWNYLGRVFEHFSCSLQFCFLLECGVFVFILLKTELFRFSLSLVRDIYIRCTFAEENLSGDLCELLKVSTSHTRLATAGCSW